MTVSKIREQLIAQKSYDNIDLPTNQTLNTIVNGLGYKLKKVQKAKPLKKIPETNAIFKNLTKFHEEIADDEKVVRLSIDAKDRVKIGEFSRGGKSRVNVKAVDHDFCDKYVVPFGIINVKTGTIDISIAESKVTADYIVDRLEEHWIKNAFQNGETLVLNSDNGPECNSRRTQFIKRMVDFAIKFDSIVYLAYYPPYHSKYNPIERVWGVLEQHWNGDLLDSTDAVVGFAKSMTYKGKNPEVTLISQVYETGKTLEKKVMDIYEKALDRMDCIGKWFVKIDPSKCKAILDMELLV